MCVLCVKNLAIQKILGKQMVNGLFQLDQRKTIESEE